VSFQESRRSYNGLPGAGSAAAEPQRTIDKTTPAGSITSLRVLFEI